MKPWGIRGRVLFLSVVPAVVIAGGLTLYDIHTRIRDSELELRNRGLAIVRQLSLASEFGVFSGNYQVLARLARSALSEADVTAVTITNSDGRILSTQGTLRADPPLTATSSLKEPDVTEHPTVLVFSAPIVQSQTTVEDYLDQRPGEASKGNADKVLGHVVVEVSRRGNSARKSHIVASSMLITLAGLAATILLALKLAHQVTRRSNRGPCSGADRPRRPRHPGR